MKTKQFLTYYFLITCFFCLITACFNHNSNKTELQELKVRKGLPNFFSKISHKDTIRIAYFGGSITERDGWRTFSLEWFKKRFPKVEIIEINAAIGGTGSEFGAFRLYNHVLKYNPDLVFVEFAVNDKKFTSDKIIKSMEGIIRQIWQENPFIDICFIYTFHENFLETEQKGLLPNSIRTMEEIADYYKIPSINFNKTIYHLFSDNKLIIKENQKEINGIPVFSPDGVHPYVETGQKIYFKSLKRSIKKLENIKSTSQRKHSLPVPMNPNCFSNGKILDFTKANLSPNWEIIPTEGDSIFIEFNKFLQVVGKASRKNESLTIQFKGKAIGIYDIMGPDAGKVIIEIDDTLYDTISRFDMYCTYYRMNYFIIDNLEDKVHKAKFRLFNDPFDKVEILLKRKKEIKDPNKYIENNWYIGKILLDGYLIKH